MAVYTSAAALANKQRRRALQAMIGLQAGSAEVVRKSIDDIEQLTSGTLTAKQLRKMGHPYGREAAPKKAPAGTRGKQRLMAAPKALPDGWKFSGGNKARGRWPVLPINNPGGRLKLRVQTHRWTDGKKRYVTFDFGFDKGLAPWAKFLLAPGGTKKMVARPLKREVYKRGIKHQLDWVKKMRASLH